MGESLAFAMISWICAALFIGNGIFSLKKKTPMHFWAGTTVKSEAISDVKAYNRANGVMWIIYGATFVISGILSVVVECRIGAIFMAACSSFGLLALIFTYMLIYKKYKV